MLGLILIYFIGKRFMNLAEARGKHRWGFAIAGVASYYVGTFIAGVGIIIYQEIAFADTYRGVGSSDIALSLISIPFGILACFGFYKILEKTWSKNPNEFNPDILDD